MVFLFSEVNFLFLPPPLQSRSMIIPCLEMKEKKMKSSLMIMKTVEKKKLISIRYVFVEEL